MARERLQKILARVGLASRRKAEEIITAGRVTINGETIRTLGTKADSIQDRITVDGRPVGSPSETIVYALNKPVGVITTQSDEHGRPRVVDLVPNDPPVYPVGRLDRVSEGLILLTNDGALAHELTHPKFAHEKDYELTGVCRTAPRELVARFEAGVMLTDGQFQPDAVGLAGLRDGHPILRITIHEGRHHLLRRAAAELGFEIIRLRRVRIGTIELGKLSPGQYRILSAKEIDSLRSSRLG